MERSHQTTSTTPDSRPWLFWDGACGFCCWFILWMRRRNGEEMFRIVPYQNAPPEISSAEFQRRAARAVQVVTREGERLEAGRACVYVLGKLGWKRWARVLAVPPLIWKVEFVYWIVARNRSFFAQFVSADPKACRGDGG